MSDLNSEIEDNFFSFGSEFQNCAGVVGNDVRTGLVLQKRDN